MLCADASKASSAPGQPQGNEQELWQPNEDIITEFALSVLSQWVRKGKLDVASDAHTRSRVSPLLPKLAAGVGLRSSACAQLCFKCLAGLVPAGLPGMASAAEQASKPLWKILSNRQRLDSLLSQVLATRTFSNTSPDGIGSECSPRSMHMFKNTAFWFTRSCPSPCATVG